MTIFFYCSFYFFLILIFFINYKTKGNFKDYFLSILFLILILISSFRYNVGGDWETYYQLSNNPDLINYLHKSIPFILINYFSFKINLGIFGVNLTITILLLYSLFLLSHKLKLNLFLILPIFFSSIYLPVLMGYTRQALAIAFIFFTIYFYLSKKDISFLIFSLLSILTHASSFLFLILIPVRFYEIFQTKQKNKFLIFLLFSVIVSIFVFIYIFENFYLLEISTEVFILNGQMYISKGVIFRLTPYIFAIILFFFQLKYIKAKYFEIFNFLNFNLVLIIFLFIILTIFEMSTLVDRVILYNFIFYLIIISVTFDNIFNTNLKIIYTTLLYLMHFVMLITWLIIGDYSPYWHNYKFLY